MSGKNSLLRVHFCLGTGKANPNIQMLVFESKMPTRASVLNTGSPASGTILNTVELLGSEAQLAEVSYFGAGL